MAFKMQVDMLKFSPIGLFPLEKRAPKIIGESFLLPVKALESPYQPQISIKEFLQD